MNTSFDPNRMSPQPRILANSIIRIVLCMIVGAALNLHLEVACAADAPPCPAPAKSITAQVNDLCFALFSTDDIAHPGVDACVTALTSGEDSCQRRTAIKSMLCHFAFQKELSGGQLSIGECIRSESTEGYFVQGCEYPFEKECIERVKRKGGAK